MKIDELNARASELRDKIYNAQDKLDQQLAKIEDEDRSWSDAEKEERAGVQAEIDGWQERLDHIQRKLGTGPHSKTLNADIGLSDTEKRRYSLRAALAAMASPGDARLQEAAKFEREVSEALQEGRAGREPPRGMYIPRFIFGGGDDHVEKRTQLAADGSLGGYLVDESLREDLFIGLLRNSSVMGQLGVRMLPGLVGDVLIPKQDSAGTVYWVQGEETDITESTAGFGQLTLRPKHMGVHTRLSRQLLVQTIAWC